MIFETIISTTDKKGKVNFAPFGIKKKSNLIYISPYIPSKTLENIEATNCAVINYTNNALFFVNCILGKKEFKKNKSSKLFRKKYKKSEYWRALKDSNLRPSV